MLGRQRQELERRSSVRAKLPLKIDLKLVNVRTKRFELQSDRSHRSSSSRIDLKQSINAAS